MKYLFSIFLILLSLNVYSQTEMKYNAKSENLPNWAELMYSEKSDEGEQVETENQLESDKEGSDSSAQEDDSKSLEA